MGNMILRIFFCAVFLWSTSAFAADQLASKDTRITAEKLGLPKTNQRSSEPFVTRIYKTDGSGDILKKQPNGFPFTIKEDYFLKENEKPRVHEGVDLQSRPSPNEIPIPLEFKAGIHGIVVRAGDGNVGMIAVQVWDGSVLEFLHTSASFVKVGDIVAPGTALGLTGKKGASTIHLHVQAKSSLRKPISPDLVFRIGQRRLQSSEKPEDVWEDYDPDESNSFEPKIIEEKKVPIQQLPKTKWVVEIIGGGGVVQGNLGEFGSYSAATSCSVAWSKANPDDLRLTREREVEVAAK